jgi:hypothetical protein
MAVRFAPQRRTRMEPIVYKPKAHIEFCPQCVEKLLHFYMEQT